MTLDYDFEPPNRPLEDYDTDELLDTFSQAFEKRNFSQMREVLDAGVNVNWVSSDTCQPILIHTVLARDIEMIEFLLSLGIDPNRQDEDGYSALMFASRRGELQIVEILIKAGAKPNLSDRGGCTPIEAAAWEGHTHVVEFLSGFYSEQICKQVEHILNSISN